MSTPSRTGFTSEQFKVGSLVILAVLAALFALEYASTILIPMAAAWLLSGVLSPVTRYCRNYGIPPAVSALVLMALLVYGIATLFILAIDPVQQWLENLPTIIRDLRQNLAQVSGSMVDLRAISEEVRQLYEADGGDYVTPVKVEGENVTRKFLIDNLPTFIASLAVMVFLTYFLLASGDRFLRKLTKMGGNWSSRRRIVTIARSIRQDISRYLLTITVINMTLGLCVALAMKILGVPNPMLWGLMAALFNFAPYIGAVITATVLTLVGIATFPSLPAALLVPAVYIALSVAEGHMITPMVVGRRLALSPTAVFVAVIAWGWLWGVPGALMAVPILASIKILCENIPRLNPISRILQP